MYSDRPGNPIAAVRSHRKRRRFGKLLLGVSDQSKPASNNRN
jgi:hypothetical protein